LPMLGNNQKTSNKHPKRQKKHCVVSAVSELQKTKKGLFFLMAFVGFAESQLRNRVINQERVKCVNNANKTEGLCTEAFQFATIAIRSRTSQKGTQNGYNYLN